MVGNRDTGWYARARWAAEAAQIRSHRRAHAEITLAELLEVWFQADHGWRPSTAVGYRSIAAALAPDRLGHRRAVDITPRVLRAAMAAWQTAGLGEPTIFARVR